ncbi:MAG: formyltransferase family protein [Candidatus Bathyarchaeota archaeon]|nr:formyltransferase family protein [Candidatus Bathyarchaeota archaeon]
MTVSPIYPYSAKRKMHVALFVSGSGTNGLQILERSKQSDSNYEVTLIFSDVKDERTKKSGDKMCRAKDIAEEWGVGYEFVDIRDFYAEHGLKRTDLSIRPDFDRLVLEKLEDYDIDLIANAGYMSIMTSVLLNRYAGKVVNVHPADLTVMDGEKRKYVGIHVVEEAILAGDKEIRSTTHIVREEVDHGEILVLSKPVKIMLEYSLVELEEDKSLRKEVVSGYQDKLKEGGDWVIYPLTIQMISMGRFALGPDGVYLDGEPAPYGFQL